MLFFISFIFVFLSGYLLASVLTKKDYEHFSYVLLSAFAQIVLIFEILSLFKAINPINILVLNIIIFTICLLFWLKNNKPFYFPDIKAFCIRIKNALKLDKILIVPLISFIILILGSIALNLIIPLANADASDYHVARSMWYVLQGSLEHFDVADIRAVVFPFNSEILYAWLLLLLKKEVFLGFFSFTAFILCLSSVYTMLKLLGFSLRKRLWVIFVVSSFSSVIVQLTSTETDIFIAGLILSSIVLFWFSLKEKNKTPLLFAALAYALAIGTKTTAIIAIPAVALIMGVLSFKYKNLKNLLLFCVFVFFNFLIFSSYNYILNFIDYGNVMGTNSAVTVHKNFYGIKGMIANFVRHIYLFFDFTGFKWGEYIGELIFKTKVMILSLLHVANVQEGIYSNPGNKFDVNSSMLEPKMGLGILGLIVYLPCFLYAFGRQFFTRKNKENFLGILSVSFFVFLLTLSYLIVYMNFNVRFMTMFVVVVSPILVYSYFKKYNIFKIIVVLFMVYYMVLVSTHIWARPLNHIVSNCIFKNETISDIRFRIKCSNFYTPKNAILDEDCYFWYKMAENIDLKSNKILYFTSSSSNLAIPGMLNLNGLANIDLGLVYKHDDIDFQKYDYIVFRTTRQYMTSFNDDIVKINYTLNGKNINIKEKKPYYCFFSNTSDRVVEDDIKTIKKNLRYYPYCADCFFDEDVFIKNNFKYQGTVKDTFNLYKRY